MKKRLLYGTLFFGLLIGVFSCQHDSLFSKGDETRQHIGGLTIDEARLYFEGFLTDFEVYPFNDLQLSVTEQPVIFPLWSKGRQFLLEGIPTIEIPYNLEFCSTRILEDSAGEKMDRPAQFVRYCLVVQTDPDGEISFHTAILAPSEAYQSRMGTDIFSNMSLTTLDGFSGEVKYYDMKGELVGGFIYRDGGQVGVVGPPAHSPDREYDCLPGETTQTRAWKYGEYCEVEIWRNEQCYPVTTWNNAEQVWQTKYECTVYYEEIKRCYPIAIWVDDPDPGSGGNSNAHPDPEGVKKIPCRNDSKNLANPLIEMKLAPSGDGGWNIAGATFGKTRYDMDGKLTRNHDGIDLAAKVGTPVYAMFPGVITKIVSEQPDRPYPPNYKGDDNSAGNRIYINSTIDGKTVSLWYCHLEAGNAIGWNPRAERNFVVGDEVRASDIIGYTGISGNANNIAVPHLHLSARLNGKPVDPAIFLNATVTKTSVIIVTPCDDY